MRVPLGHCNAEMSRQLHDCKCMRSRFRQPGKEAVRFRLPDRIVADDICEAAPIKETLLRGL